MELFDNPLSVINGAALMDMDIPRRPFVVRGLLPQGLSILGGAPKIGKSWLMLDLCVRVAKGKPLWNMETHRGAVLYLCLEDTYQRLQQRLTCITDDVPENLFFALAASTLAEDLEEQLLQFIREHPDTVLIVIDTLQLVRSGKNEPSYGGDYDDIQKLKRIAESQHIALLLVHHLRKMGDSDPVHRLSGTTGISGAVDCVFVLDKSTRLEDVATLTCTGRDIQQREMELRFDKTNFVWNKLSDSAERDTPQLPPDMVAFVEFIKSIGSYEGGNTELAEMFAQHSGITLSAKILKQKMNRWCCLLSDLGISFWSKEQHNGKVVGVKYTPPVSHASQVSQDSCP